MLAYPPTIPTEYALLAADEIERLRLLITNWMDAEYDSNCEDPSYYHQDVADAWQALRKAVGRENILGPR